MKSRKARNFPLSLVFRVFNGGLTWYGEKKEKTWFIVVKAIRSKQAREKSSFCLLKYIFYVGKTKTMTTVRITKTDENGQKDVIIERQQGKLFL